MILSVQHFSIWSSTEVSMRDEHTKEMGRKKTRDGGNKRTKTHFENKHRERNIHQNRLVNYFSQF